MRIKTPVGEIPVVRRFCFPDGQPHLELGVRTLYPALGSVPAPARLHLCRIPTATIDSRVTTSVELLEILLAADILAPWAGELHLRLSYLWGRMDRRIDDQQPFTLKVVAGLLRGVGFRSIELFDPHSDVSVALLDNPACHLRIRTPWNHVRHALAGMVTLAGQQPLVIIPDQGATRRTEALQLPDHVETFQLFKHRDSQTGKLSGFSAAGDPAKLTGRSCLIVDDLCDGGGTFVAEAELLRQHGARHVGLYCTHGIFSKGLPLDGIDHIWTTDSFRDFTEAEKGHLTVIDCWL